MANNVYSTYETARSKAYERMKELEQDVFICESKYRSGHEFLLKTRDQIMSCANYLYMVEVPFKHKFQNEKNAQREAEMFEKKQGKKVSYKKVTFEENGYNKFSHYELCLI